MSSDTNSGKIKPLYERNGIAYYQFSYKRIGEVIVLEDPITMYEFCRLLVSEFAQELKAESVGNYVVFSASSHYTDSSERAFSLTSYVVRDIVNSGTESVSLADLIY